MEISPVNRVDITAPMNSAANAPVAQTTDREVVSAVQELNRSDLMGQDRELSYRRDPKTGRSIIQIVSKGSGDVIDQIPPEVVLQLRAEFDRQLKGKASEE